MSPDNSTPAWEEKPMLCGSNTDSPQNNSGQPAVNSSGSALDNNGQSPVVKDIPKGGSTKCNDSIAKGIEARKRVLELMKKGQYSECYRYITGGGSWALGQRVDDVRTKANIMLRIGDDECNIKSYSDVGAFCSLVTDGGKVTSFEQFRDANYAREDTCKRAAFAVIASLLTRYMEPKFLSAQPQIIRALERMYELCCQHILCNNTQLKRLMLSLFTSSVAKGEDGYIILLPFHRKNVLHCVYQVVLTYDVVPIFPCL